MQKLTVKQKAAAFDLIADAVPVKVLAKALGLFTHEQLATHLRVSYSHLWANIQDGSVPPPDFVIRRSKFFTKARFRDAVRAYHDRVPGRRGGKPKSTDNPVILEMIELRRAGKTLREIAEQFNTSRQRVHQLLKIYEPVDTDPAHRPSSSPSPKSDGI